ncbi:hypothetical protein F511_01552 [Dorcoceras hygrometricum]|nr:hypothetical protein F511_01552 [Dorcoceras hygrometricum]
MQLSSNVIARKDPGEYWQHVMKEEPMPEYIQGLVGASKVTCTDNNNNKRNKGHLHISSQKTSLDPIPSATAYNDDVKPENDKDVMKDQRHPRFNNLVYGNNKHFHISSEKTISDLYPSVTAYADDVKPENDRHFTEEFEPIPNITAYTDDVKSENVKPENDRLFTEEFEPIPNISAYTDDVKPKGERSFTKEFEPSPNVSLTPMVLSS